MCPGTKARADEIELPFWRCGQVRIRLVLIEKNTSEGAKTGSQRSICEAERAIIAFGQEACGRTGLAA